MVDIMAWISALASAIAEDDLGLGVICEASSWAELPSADSFAGEFDFATCS